MRRLRYIVASGVLVLGLALGVRQLLPLGGAVRPLLPHIADRRCRGGCLSPLLRVLPGGPIPAQIGAGSLLSTWGNAVTDTRASSKTCCTNASCSTVVTLGNNQPCVDTVGLNVEGGATNLCLQSQALDNAAWTATAVTVAANVYVAPDGTTTAESLAWTNATNGLQSTTTTASATAYTGSGWVYAASGSPSVTVAVRDTTAASDLCTQSATASTTWQRISCTTGTATAGHALAIVVRGTNATTVGAWGAQLETGTFATSYIATAGTTATRAADVAQVAGPFAIGNTPSFSADFTVPASNDGNTYFIINADNASNDRWDLYVSNIGTLNCDYFNGSGHQVVGPVVTAGAKAHASCYYDGVTMKVCLNGTSCNTAALSFSPTSTSYPIGLGSDLNPAGTYLFGDVASICVSGQATGCR